MPAYRNLRALIRASGHAGTAGQSFREHVTGAGPGVSLRQYIHNGWSNFSGGGIGSNVTFDSGTVFDLTFYYDCGPKYGLIRPAPTISMEGDYRGAEAKILSYGEAQPGSGNTISLQVFGKQIYPSFPHVSYNWFADTGGDTTSIPSPTSENRPWEIRIGWNQPQAGPDNYSDVEFSLKQPQDAGWFNDQHNQRFSVRMYERTAPNALNVQWFSDAELTELVTDGFSVSFQSGVNYNHGSYWWRYKYPGDPSWGPATEVTWRDPRF